MVKQTKEVKNAEKSRFNNGFKPVFYLGADSLGVYRTEFNRRGADTNPDTGGTFLADAASDTDGSTDRYTDAITEPDQPVGPGADTVAESNGSHADPRAVTNAEAVRVVRDLSYRVKGSLIRWPFFLPKWLRRQDLNL